jgi:hypothetical protein
VVVAVDEVVAMGAANGNPMTSDPLYVHHLSGRRPAVVFAFLVNVAMAGFGLYHSAAWYFMAPVGLAVIIAAAAMLSNPQTGARMTADTLYFYNRQATRDVQLSDIQSAQTRSFSDGAPDVVLTLHSGEQVAIPSMCIDSGFPAALEKAGVPVNGV